jgi:hypothetical protein
MVGFPLGEIAVMLLSCFSYQDLICYPTEFTGRSTVEKEIKKIRIRAEFDIQEDVWKMLPECLQVNGMVASAGIGELSPADLVAYLVMKYGQEVK